LKSMKVKFNIFPGLHNHSSVPCVLHALPISSSFT
jgi:hypothetical protein